MSDTTPGAHSAIRVLAALAALGEATAAAIADKAQLGYSTTTPKLRAWENTGQAERVRTDDGRTLWRLTAAGHAATATPTNPPGAPDRAPADPAAAADEPDTTTTTTAADHTDQPTAAAPHTAANPDGLDQADVTTGPDTGHCTAEPTAAHSDTTHGGSDADAPTDATDADPGAGDSGVDPDAAQAAPHGPPRAEVPAGTADSPPQQDNAPDLSADPAGEAGDASSPVGGGQPNTSVHDTTAPARRVPGSLRAAILDVCQTDPDRQFKVAELCRLIDSASAGTGAKKAAQGAVYNACTKLAAAGTLTQTVDKPATFRLSPASD